VTPAASTDDFAEHDPVRELWRRQLVLAVVTTAVGVGAIKLMQLSIDREADVRRVVLANGTTLRSASYLATMWPAAIALVGVAIVIAVLVVHTIRVAAYTFRRGATDHGSV
jgi:hypothetical protein